MADTVSVDYIYPPFMEDGEWDLKSGNRRVIVRFTGLSDATGETDVVKVDLSDLKTPSGNVPQRTVVESIKYQIQGMAVILEWDRNPHKEIVRLNDFGFNNAEASIGEINWRSKGGLTDPGLDDATGDILLTSTNTYAGDTYDITLCLRLKD